MTLHVAVSGWLLGPHSGANRRLLALLAHTGPLLGEGERVTVLHRPEFAPLPLPRIAWRAVAIPAGPTLRRAFAGRRQLATVLQQLRANVLDHAFLPLPRVAVPICLTVHDTRGADGLTRWPRWLARGALRTACTRAAAVITPSQWTAARIRAIAPAAHPHVVGNGVELPQGASTPLATLPDNGYLLHTGHLEPRKNLAVVVRALRQLPAAARPQLWLAGRDAGSLRSLQQLAGDDVALRAFGPVPENDLARLYAHARAVVMPSRYEGFGLPILEALAHGRPVLASDAGALPEVLGDVGTLLPSDDANAWAAAIAATPVAAPARKDHQERAAAFAWPTAAAALLQVWRTLSR